MNKGDFRREVTGYQHSINVVLKRTKVTWFEKSAGIDEESLDQVRSHFIRPDLARDFWNSIPSFHRIVHSLASGGNHLWNVFIGCDTIPGSFDKPTYSEDRQIRRTFSSCKTTAALVLLVALFVGAPFADGQDPAIEHDELITITGRVVDPNFNVVPNAQSRADFSQRIVDPDQHAMTKQKFLRRAPPRFRSPLCIPLHSAARTAPDTFG